jgi:tetratricopeptide (TPR) repeat protein
MADSLMTFLVQKTGGAVSPLALIPLHARLANALISYLRYISKTFWPADLAAFYPYSNHWPIGLVLGAGLSLTTCSIWLVMRSRRYPYLGVGWFWYLGTLVPVIGLVQVGAQSMADRYMYIPSIGLFILVVWGVHALCGSSARWQRMGACGGAIALIGCVACTSVQVTYWRDGVSLFRHAVEVTTDKWAAYGHLGNALDISGRKAEALSYYAEVVRLQPYYAEGHWNLGTILMEQDRLEEAVNHLNIAIACSPNFARAHYNLGIALGKQGKTEEAIAHYAEAVRLDPTNPDMRFNLGQALLKQNKAAGAAAQFAEALRLKPDDAQTRYRLAQALARQHKSREAVAQYRETLRVLPDLINALDDLAWILATEPDPGIRDGAEAVRLAQKACELTQSQHPAMLTTLAAAYAEAGRFAEALQAAQKARDLALASDQKEAAEKAGELLKLCQSGQPFRQSL